MDEGGASSPTAMFLDVDGKQRFPLRMFMLDPNACVGLGGPLSVPARRETCRSAARRQTDLEDLLSPRCPRIRRPCVWRDAVGGRLRTVRTASRIASGDGTFVARSMPTPDQAMQRINVGLILYQPGRDQRNSRTHGLTRLPKAVGDEHVDMR